MHCHRNQTAARFGASVNDPGVLNVYDGFGRMTSSTNAMSGTPLTLTYEYDANGNRTKITHPDGAYFAYVYDGLNRNRFIRENGSTYLKNGFYNNRGQLQQNTRAIGMASQTGFDAIGRVSSMTTLLPGTASDNIFTFAYNPASQIKSRTTSNDGYTNSAHYDVTRSYAVNGLNQYTTAGPAAFTYDANGNLTSDGDVTFTYDAENRLVSASGAKTLNLVYDPLGRLWETSQAGNASITRFLYDGDALVAEYDYTGNLTDRYVHDNGADVPLVWYEGSAVGASSRRHLFANWQGSITAITDSAGAAIGINAYDSYGIPNDTNIGRFQYTGQIYLPELGIYHYKARAYSPYIGRFFQTDPIGYEDQFNLYAYVGNDPVNGVDPTGMQSCKGDEACPDIAPIPVENAREIADGAASGQRNGNEGGANSYINDTTGARRLETGADAGRGESGNFRHTLEPQKGERVEAIGHTHLDRGRGQRGVEAMRGRTGQNAPSTDDQAAMNQINAPVITVGPDVSTQLYREGGQDKLQVIDGNPAKVPNVGSQKITVCPGTTPC